MFPAACELIYLLLILDHVLDFVLVFDLDLLFFPLYINIPSVLGSPFLITLSLPSSCPTVTYPPPFFAFPPALKESISEHTQTLKIV